MNAYCKISKQGNPVTGAVMTLKQWLLKACFFAVGGALLLAARKVA